MADFSNRGGRPVPPAFGPGRCPAAHPEDPTPCDGPPVVTVLDRHNAGADGCEHHGARLLASLEGGRVVALPDAPEGAAIRVFTAAGSIRPFPWLTDAPRTEPSQLSHEENRRGAVQSPRYGEGTVTLQTRDRGEVTVPEPAWCAGHDGQVVGALADLAHDGAEIPAVVDTAATGPVQLLSVNLTHAPFLEAVPEPHPLAYVQGLEAASVGSTDLRMVAARLVVYAGTLRDLADELDRLEREVSP